MLKKLSDWKYPSLTIDLIYLKFFILEFPNPAAMTSEKPKTTWTLEFMSGLIGGLISVALCAPLDITRTRLNLMVRLKFYG